MTTAPLELSALGFDYRSVPALESISLIAQPGRVHAVLGPNGAGKSTTIACAVGLLRPTRGTARIFGRDPVAEHTATAGLTGVMLQDGGLPMSARPLAALRHLSRMYADPLDVDAIAERLGITAYADRTIRRLSGGQRQRVGLAAALIGRPRLVFLDEPTAGLDPQASLVVREVVGELRADGVAVVLTTHDMADAQQLADTVTIIDHGRVIAAGSPAELTAASDGAHSVRMRLAAPAPAGLAAALARFGAVREHGAGGGEVLTVSGDFGPAELAGLTAVLAEHGVRVTDLSLHGRTLADVFLELTGRSLR
ncbi:ABC transporter ATP-binding protein [Brevibacterium ihuae]|uniref:ABC transporter ATP-binding protein n=1 Tax=Brevibacterium ihuae TaxID=1631743 RepID=UPI000C78ABC2|nr:ABC transporter ATP-binding protein [Brevibacterium ihuae]